MKKYIFTLILCFVTVLSYGQSKITAHVDMGTSVEWANATMDDLYRYGELTPSSHADETSYRFYSSLTDGLQWTYTNKEGGVTTSTYNKGFTEVPLDIAGNEDYDAAMTLGDGWRLPTISEAKELMDNCNINASSDNKYFIITSNVTGNIIVVPNIGYITHIRETKQNMHIMLGETSIVEPRKYAATLSININSTTNPDISLRNYCSIDKVTCSFPILPVYSTETRAKLRVTTYNSETGDVLYEDEDGTTYIQTSTGNQRRAKYYVSCSGVISESIPNTEGIYMVVYNNGDTEKILVK